MPELERGDHVLVDWGLVGYVEAEVEDVYGPPARRHVLVRLDPEFSGDVVDEPVTISVPIDAVTQVVVPLSRARDVAHRSERGDRRPGR